MAARTIEAARVRHLFGGVSENPYTPTPDDGLTPSPLRMPLANPVSLETLFAQLWERHGNGAKPVREYCFHAERKWRFDFCFPDFMVAVECDGIICKAGGGRHNTDGDRDKMNHAASMGWLTLRFSRAQLEDQPEHTAKLVAKALEYRSKG